MELFWIGVKGLMERREGDRAWFDGLSQLFWLVAKVDYRVSACGRRIQPSKVGRELRK